MGFGGSRGRLLALLLTGCGGGDGSVPDARVDANAPDASAAGYRVDPLFGTDGVTIIDGFDATLTIARVAPIADGFVVAGWSSGVGAVCRLRADGTLDAGFAGGCIPARAHAFAAAHGDAILVVDGDGADPIRVSRRLADGGLDPGFGTGGELDLPNLGTGSSASDPRRLVADPDGTYVIESVEWSPTTHAFIQRIDATGAQLDSVEVQTANGVLNDTIITVSGSIVVSTGPTIYRFDASLSLDPTFGTGGAADVAADTLAELADGRFVLGGQCDPCGFGAITAAGVVDGSFGSGGVARGDGVDLFWAAGTPSGGFLAVGEDRTTYAGAIVELSASGDPIARLELPPVPPPPQTSRITHVVRDGDTFLVSGVLPTVSGPTRIYVARYVPA